MGVRQAVEEILKALDNSDLSDFSNDEAEAGFDTNVNEELIEEQTSESDDENDDEPLAAIAVKSKKVDTKSAWTKAQKFEPELMDFQIPAVTSIIDNSKLISYVEQFILEDIFAMMSECSNRKSVLDTGKNLNTSAIEIKRFFGITVLMSCVGYPRIKMYWNKSLQVPAIATTMNRDRYFKIRNNLKVVVDLDVPDDQKKTDRLWKVRPLLDQVRQGCLRIPRTSKVSIDEQMIPFTGQTSLKQYVPNKPHPTGLKNFVLATPNGIVLDFVIYQGKNTFASSDSKDKSGVGCSAINYLSQTLLPGTHIFCDRYFTTTALIEYLRTKHIYVSGTIMKNRIGEASVAVADDKSLSKKPRGSSDMVIRSDKSIAVVKWFDNKPVLMASSAFGISPETIVKRWSKKDKKYINIPCPSIIKEYNQNMGGVDLIDRMIALYRNKARTKRWTVRTIMHMFDLAISNAWLQYRQCMVQSGAHRKEILQYLDFRMAVAESWIAAEDPLDISFSDDEADAMPGKRRPVIPQPSESLRTSGAKHFPKMVQQKNASRCRNNGCSGKTRVQCTGCKMFLCIAVGRDCFLDYHSNIC